MVENDALSYSEILGAVAPPCGLLIEHSAAVPLKIEKREIKLMGKKICLKC